MTKLALNPDDLRVESFYPSPSTGSLKGWDQDLEAPVGEPQMVRSYPIWDCGSLEGITLPETMCGTCTTAV